MDVSLEQRKALEGGPTLDSYNYRPVGVEGGGNELNKEETPLSKLHHFL